jgi:hypothetical protein
VCVCEGVCVCPPRVGETARGHGAGRSGVWVEGEFSTSVCVLQRLPALFSSTPPFRQVLWKENERGGVAGRTHWC